VNVLNVNVRRLYGPVVLGTLAAGGVAFFAASRTWAYASVTAQGLPSDRIEVTGSAAQPSVSALALVTVTSALAVLASSQRVRRVVGLFTVAVALGGFVLVVIGGSSRDDAFGRALKASPAFTGANEVSAHHTVWAATAAISFALVAVCGSLTARFGSSWPTMGSQYDAPQPRSHQAPVRTDAEIWKAFDDGHDPTQ